MRFFASAQPGFGPLLAEEIAELGAHPSAPISDGRNDLVTFDVRGTVPALSTAEDVFASISEPPASRDLAALVDSLVEPAALERALSTYASGVRPLRARETFRVVARVSSERDFLRTQLRDAMVRRVAQLRSRWRPGDPAEMELWTMQVSDGWRCGLRLTRRPSRTDERPGSLRPSVAAAMLRLAATSGRILDPFCGSGTILSTAARFGLSPYGCDVDAAAIAVSRANTGVSIVRANANAAPFVDGSFDAIVSNLPFGKRFSLDGTVEDALGRLRGLIAPHGCAVILTARDATIPDVFTTERKLDVEVLGQPATLWKLR